MVEFFAVGIADARKVVNEGVKPDIGDKASVKRQGNAPIEAAFGPGYA